MKMYHTLFCLLFATAAIAQDSIGVPDDIKKFQAFIGDWYTVPDPEMIQQFPETKDMVGFRFEWDDPNQKILRYYEGIPSGDLDKAILGNLVTQNPRTGEIEFLGYQMRNDFLFKGSFHFIDDGNGFVRLYDVYYPHHTKFRNAADSIRGMITYRDVCHLIGSDTLECKVERFEKSFWKPWGDSKPFQMRRKPKAGYPIPKFVFGSWQKYTNGNGRWIADNSSYKNETEPYDAYGMEWEWGLGKKSIKGRLFCLKDGKDIGTVWQFLNYWDAEVGEERIIQIGSDGTVGKGNIKYEEDGSSRSSEKFISPEGASFASGHHSWFEENSLHTQSFNITKGEWTKRRFYIWKQENNKTNSAPEVYQEIAWLIGEWKSGFGEADASMKFTWDENKRMINYQNSFSKEKGAPRVLESKGIITYHGVREQIIFVNTYLKKNSHLISEGWYEVKDGVIHRHFTCHYKEGDPLPWSDGAKAPRGGKSIQFKQIWTPIDQNYFNGEFYWFKDGQWENPIKEHAGRKEVWRRVE